MSKRSRGVGFVATAALALVTVTACFQSKAEERIEEAETETGAYVSRPDLVAPGIEPTSEAGDTVDEGAEDGYVFLAAKNSGAPAKGPVIVEPDGEPVWINPVGDRWTYDFRAQRYQGKPVLTWWRGQHLPTGYGRGEYVLMNRSYQEIASVTTPGVHADFHHMDLTSRGTALMTAFPIVRRDLSDMGGPKDGYVANCVVQEVDVETGKTVFKWNMIKDVPLKLTMADPKSAPDEPGTKRRPLDPYHVNSVAEDGKNHLLVSARNTSAIYRIDQRTGELDWTLGGEGSDFEMRGESEFYWQHDAQRRSDGTISLFDNQANPDMGGDSRGLVLDLDQREQTASVEREYLPPDDRLSGSQGNMQVRQNGSVVIGWGSEQYYSEYTPDGELVLDQAVDGQSYRAFRMPWTGTPTEPPAFVLRDGTAYVSWNGATEVAEWRFIAGDDRRGAEEVETVPREGFETSAEMPDRTYIAAQALDSSGKVLATAEPGGWPNGSGNSDAD